MSLSWLIVGLGNPGQSYLGTRHNVGADCLRYLATARQGSWQVEGKFSSECWSDQNLLYLLPQTFMNLSGNAVQRAMNFYKIPLDHLLVLHDELDLSPGKMQMKFAGGANGHRGLKHIIECLGSDQFWRLKIGIGRPAMRGAVTSFVLARPATAERELIVANFELFCSFQADLFAGNMLALQQRLHRALARH